MKRDKSEQNKLVEFAANNIEKALAVTVVAGAIATKFLRDRHRDIGLSQYSPEDRHRDSYNLFQLGIDLMDRETSTEVAAAKYGIVPPVVTTPGHLVVERASPDMVDTSISFFPTIFPPATKGDKIPILPRTVYQTVTTLKFQIPEDWARENGSRYYETTWETETSLLPTEGAASWEELAKMVDDGQIEGELAGGTPRVGPQLLTHEEALAYQKCLRLAEPI